LTSGIGKQDMKKLPLPNLDMPAMTMVFQVKEKAMLDPLKAGDKVNFEAQNVGGTLTATAIRKAN
jgi:Cu/Ag efflux protein CusF